MTTKSNTTKTTNKNTKEAPKEAPKVKLIPIIASYNFWDEDGVKHLKGVEVEVSAALAKKLVEAGKAERTDW